MKEDVGVMNVFRHLATRCLLEMRRNEDEDDLRMYSSEPRTPSVISNNFFSPQENIISKKIEFFVSSTDLIDFREKKVL